MLTPKALAAQLRIAPQTLQAEGVVREVTGRRNAGIPRGDQHAAALIRRGAAEVLSDNIRRQRQQDSARALLAGLLGDNS